MDGEINSTLRFPIFTQTRQSKIRINNNKPDASLHIYKEGEMKTSCKSISTRQKR